MEKHLNRLNFLFFYKIFGFVCFPWKQRLLKLNEKIVIFKTWIPIFENLKNSKIFLNFEVINFKIFWGRNFARKLSQKFFEVDNFIFSEKIQFFPKFFFPFWAIPLFFRFFFQNFFRKKCPKFWKKLPTSKKFLPDKLQNICSSPAKNLFNISRIRFVK